MTFATFRPAVRRLACVALLAAMAAEAHAGALADGYRIAGELYGASLTAVSLTARKSPRSDPADAVAVPAPAKNPPPRDCAAGAGTAAPAGTAPPAAPGADKRVP